MRLLYGYDAQDSSQVDAVELSHILTDSIEFEPQYSDDGADYECTKVTVSVNAVVASAQTSPGVDEEEEDAFGSDNLPLKPGEFGEGPAATVARVRNNLSQPRQRLRIIVGTETLLDTDPPDASGNFVGVDARNGPKPLELSITRIGGTESFRIHYKIECHIIECCEDDEFLGCPSYVSHRYNEVVTIDKDFYTTRHRRGMVRTRTDFRTDPDSLRGVVLMPIEEGMRREQSQYTIDSNGYVLRYEFTDREVYRQAPAPATDADGYFMISTPDGATRIAECQVTLRGPRHATATKATLIKNALLIVQTKLRAAGVGPDPTSNSQAFKVFGMVREKLWENEITVHFRGQVFPPKDRIAKFILGTKPFSVDLPGCATGTLALDPGTRGTLNLAVLAAQLNDPCLTAAAAAQAPTQTAALETPALYTATNADDTTSSTDVSSTTAAAAGEVVAANIYINDLAADDPYLDQDAAYSNNTDDLDGMIADYQVTSNYEDDFQMVVLPAASDATDAKTAVCQLGSPTLRLIVDWAGVKIGAKPDAPSLSDNANAVLLRKTTQLEHVEVSGDGGAEHLKYTVKGRLVYVFLDRSAVTTLTFAVPPWVADPAADKITYDDESTNMDLDVI